jgi:hypothetical protein
LSKKKQNQFSHKQTKHLLLLLLLLHPNALQVVGGARFSHLLQDF